MKSVVLVPETSFTWYLSGDGALNIHDEEPTGDWHAVNTFFDRRLTPDDEPVFMAGERPEGCPEPYGRPRIVLNTNDLFGRHGLVDRTQEARGQNIRFLGERLIAASHARAIADLVMWSVRKGNSAKHVVLDDFMPTKEHKKRVHDLFEMVADRLTPQETTGLKTWLFRNPVV